MMIMNAQCLLFIFSFLLPLLSFAVNMKRPLKVISFILHTFPCIKGKNGDAQCFVFVSFLYFLFQFFLLSLLMKWSKLNFHHVFFYHLMIMCSSVFPFPICSFCPFRSFLIKKDEGNSLLFLI